MSGGSILAQAAWASLVGAALVTAGCSGSKVTTRSSAELPQYRVQSLVVVPFTSMVTPQVRDQGDAYLSAPQSVRRSDIAVSLPSNTEPALRQTVAVPAHAADKVTQLFWNRLQKRRGLIVLAGAEAWKKLPPDTAKTLESQGATVARQLKADAALVGDVSVYQERVGSRLGASPPASVGFEVKVVAADGQVLWVGNYYERQRPMTEDLMGFLQRWGAFVTADELAEYGVDALLDQFPFGTGGAQ